MKDMTPSCVLVTVETRRSDGRGESRNVLDAGSGTVLGHGTGIDGKPATCVLTCAHNLRAQRSDDQNTNTYVNGRATQPYVAHPQLQSVDLAVLAVPGHIGQPVDRISGANVNGSYWAHGYVPFSTNEFRRRLVQPKCVNTFATKTNDGIEVDHLELNAGSDSADTANWFAKGMSGGPVFDADGYLVAVARMLERSEDKARHDSGQGTPKALAMAYAVVPTSTALASIDQAVNLMFDALTLPNADVISATARSSVRHAGDDRPPPPPPPSITDDIQKGRWGGKAHKGPYRLRLGSVYRFARYFTFDVVVESDLGDLIGPFIFHLHDTYKPGIIWVRKTDGRSATLADIGSNGTYTIGVQFRRQLREGEAGGKGWEVLELDLAQADKDLQRYDQKK